LTQTYFSKRKRKERTGRLICPSTLAYSICCGTAYHEHDAWPLYDRFIAAIPQSAEQSRADPSSICQSLQNTDATIDEFILNSIFDRECASPIKPDMLYDVHE
jgi:hypothetical protein